MQLESPQSISIRHRRRRRRNDIMALVSLEHYSCSIKYLKSYLFYNHSTGCLVENIYSNENKTSVLQKFLSKFFSKVVTDIFSYTFCKIKYYLILYGYVSKKWTSTANTIHRLKTPTDSKCMHREKSKQIISLHIKLQETQLFAPSNWRFRQQDLNIDVLFLVRVCVCVAS